MNYNKVKKLIIGITTAVTMTGCTLTFNTNGNGNNQTVISTESVSEIADMIDNTDLKDNKEISELAVNIKDKSEEIAINSENIESFEKARLIRVVDGDTIVVEIENNEKLKVRLIGINTPESVAPEGYRTANTQDGEIASEYTKNLLANIEYVYLEKDVSDTDRYGRLLRYVWLELPEDVNNITIEDIENKMLNGILLKDEVAEVTIYEPDSKYKEQFLEIEH